MKKFIDIHIPVTNCNFKCHYCYVTQLNLNDTKKVIFNYSPSHVQKALSKERLGGICHFNVCGLGETLIPNEIVDYLRVLLENGHYLMVVTNGTLTKRFDDILSLPSDLLSRLGFKFSFHYLELLRLNKMNDFFSNIQKVKNAGCSFSLELTPSDELIEHIDDIKSVCMERVGALCHVTIPREENTKKIELLSKYGIDDFYDIWKTFDSKLLDFKYSLWGIKRKEFCHAGEWSGLLDLGTGILTPCYCIRGQKQNIFSDLDKKIRFIPVGNKCNMPHCYNGHSFLSMGNILSIDDCNYSELRDRVDIFGNHWLNDKMLKFLSTRLHENNDINYTLPNKIGFIYNNKKIFLNNVKHKILKKKL